MICASGPSMCAADAAIIASAQADGRCKTVAVNNTWELLPGASCLYASDGSWWDEHLPAVRARFTGELWTQNIGLVRREPWADVARRLGLHVVKSVPGAGLHPDPDTVYQHSNSGAQAMCLAVLFGVRKLILSGFDMQRTGGKHHWHGAHARLANGDPSSFVKYFDVLEAQLEAAGVLVVNCSRATALKCFLRADLAETLR